MLSVEFHFVHRLRDGSFPDLAFLGGGWWHAPQITMLMTSLRLVSVIFCHAGNGFVDGNLVEQPWQDERIAEIVVDHFHSPDLKRSSNNSRWSLRHWG